MSLRMVADSIESLVASNIHVPVHFWENSLLIFTPLDPEQLGSSPIQKHYMPVSNWLRILRLDLPDCTSNSKGLIRFGRSKMHQMEQITHFWMPRRKLNKRKDNELYLLHFHRGVTRKYPISSFMFASIKPALWLGPCETPRVSSRVLDQRGVSENRALQESGSWIISNTPLAVACMGRNSCHYQTHIDHSFNQIPLIFAKPFETMVQKHPKTTLKSPKNPEIFCCGEPHGFTSKKIPPRASALGTARGSGPWKLCQVSQLGKSGTPLGIKDCKGKSTGNGSW